jgi:hypothetical protein
MLGIIIRIHIRSVHSSQNVHPVAGVTQVLWAALLTHGGDAGDTVEVQALD